MGRLGHVGTTTPLRRELFPKGFGGEVMRLVLNTWGNFHFSCAVCHETPITALFHKALCKAYVKAGRSWFVTLEDPITDEEFGTQDGRNDLNFYPLRHYGQTIFFTVECKRLHVLRPPTAKAIAQALSAGKKTPKARFEHLADEYVTEGIARFVDERYCGGLPCGGMVGYVLDNNVAAAFARIKGEINGRKNFLKMRAVIKEPSKVTPNIKYSADTNHSRSDGVFMLHHLLLGIKRK